MRTLYDITILNDYFERLQRKVLIRPLNLGGFGGGGGGSGGPPGGFTGVLPQNRVAYDTTEAATLATPTLSGASLVDNLNHVRYRLDALEGGGSGVLSVEEDDIQVAAGVTVLNFEGSVSTLDEGSGKVTVTVTASGGGGSPLTVKEEDNSPTVSDVTEIIVTNGSLTDNGGGSVTIATSGGGGSSLTVQENDAQIATDVTVLNFEGSATVIDEGSGKATVNITVSGISGVGVSWQPSGIYGKDRNRTTGGTYKYQGSQIQFLSFVEINEIRADIYAAGTYIMTLRESDTNWTLIETIDTQVVASQTADVVFTPSGTLTVSPGIYNLVLYANDADVAWDDNTADVPYYPGANMGIINTWYGNSIPLASFAAYSAPYQLYGREGRLIII